MDRWFLTISRGSEKPNFFFGGKRPFTDALYSVPGTAWHSLQKDSSGQMPSSQKGWVSGNTVNALNAASSKDFILRRHSLWPMGVHLSIMSVLQQL